MKKKYFDEHIEFLRDNIAGTPFKDLTEQFNRRFSMNITESAIKTFVHRHRLKNNRFSWTDEQIQFIRKNIQGRKYKDLAKLFNDRFGTDYDTAQIQRMANNRGLKNGWRPDSTHNASTHFKKGHIPHNKGKKGWQSGGRAKLTQFKKGQPPINYCPIGSERISRDGYVEIKIKDPRTWRSKHTWLWEQVYGPLPKGHVIIFADGDKTNVTLDNLLLVSRQEMAMLCKNHLIYDNKDLTKAGIAIADIYLKMGERRRHESSRANDSQS
jgi:hypothetical protein